VDYPSLTIFQYSGSGIEISKVKRVLRFS